MKIYKKTDNDTLILNVEGRVDTATSPELETMLKSEIQNYSKLIFDFKNLDYISSAGLRILLGAQKFMGEQGMKVINVNDTVYEIFEITGFSLIVDIDRI